MVSLIFVVCGCDVFTTIAIFPLICLIKVVQCYQCKIYQSCIIKPGSPCINLYVCTNVPFYLFIYFTFGTFV